MSLAVDETAARPCKADVIDYRHRQRAATQSGPHTTRGAATDISPIVMSDDNALLSELGDAVDSIESRYICSGQWTMPSALKLQLSSAANSAAAPICFPMTRGSQEAELARVRAASAPSPFGHGNQTKVDTTVRKAHQLMPDQFEMSGGFDGTVPPHILERIRSELVPDAGSITAKLHKINVYEKGGFFADHKDTPRSETHFGSLVILLPCYHSGGCLSVDHGGESKRLDWANSASRDFSFSGYAYGPDRAAKIAAHTPSATLRYAAFFGDATHRVAAVSDGARVTLAYELYRDGLPDPTADALLLRAERCRAAFAALAGDASFMPEGGALGFECCHLYEEKELSAADKTLSSTSAGTASARKIKGLKVCRSLSASSGRSRLSSPKLRSPSLTALTSLCLSVCLSVSLLPLLRTRTPSWPSPPPPPASSSTPSASSPTARATSRPSTSSARCRRRAAASGRCATATAAG